MTQDEWHDLFFFLIETDHEDKPLITEKDASYIRLAAYMTKVETDLENLKQRVTDLEAREVWEENREW